MKMRFADGHVELVKLENPWPFSWHKGYVPPAQLGTDLRCNSAVDMRPYQAGANLTVEEFLDIKRQTSLETMIDSIRKPNPQCGIILMTMTPGNGFPEGHRSYRKDIEGHYEMFNS